MYLQLHAGNGSTLDVSLVEAVEVNRVQLGIHGLLAIHQTFLDPSFSPVLGIELQTLHHVAQQDARLQHLHLVVETRRVGHEAQVCHVRQHL